MHKPVLLTEVVEYLNIQSGSKIIDATLNGGGHTQGILARHPGLKIMGIEFDPDIFQEFQKLDIAPNIIAVNDSYVNLKKITEDCDFQPDGIIFDLGISSWHYEKSGRGFSFLRDEPLDMRFNPRIQVTTAADLINTLSENELQNIIAKYGEEKFADQIAEKICKIRKEKPITNTKGLTEIISAVVPGWYKRQKINPATKTFQALRIAVNDELDNVEKGILAAIDVLNNGGRLVVIAFHGLEDKIVREIFKQKVKEGIIKWVIKGTVRPQWEEIKQNPRARSAKMKVIEKISFVREQSER